MSPCESFVVSLRELPVGRSGMECRDLDVSVGEQLVSSHRTQDDARWRPGHAAQAGGPAGRLQSCLGFRCRPLLGL
jgi:hypothetical protein